MKTDHDPAGAMRLRSQLRVAISIALTLALSTTAAASGIALGSQYELSPCELDAGEGQSTRNAIAVLGEGVHVIWSDGSRLVLTIFDREGERVRELVLRNSAKISDARIASFGGQIIVIWTEDRSNRIATLRDDLTLVQPDGIDLGYGWVTDIAAVGDRILLTGLFGSNVHVVILDRDISVVARIGLFSSDARVGSNGDSFMVAWSASSSVLFAQVVRADGSVGEIIQVDPTGWSPSIGWNGSAYVVLYGAPGETRAAVVSARGVEVPGRAVWGRSSSRSSLAPHPNGFAVLGEVVIPRISIPEADQPTELYSFLISSTGERLTEPREISIVNQWSVSNRASIVRHGAGYFATWVYSVGNGDYSVRGSPLTLNGLLHWRGEVYPGRAISRQCRSQGAPKVAAGEGVFLAVWNEWFRELGVVQPRFARIDSEGRRIGDVIPLSDLPASPAGPAIACGRDTCLAIFTAIAKDDGFRSTFDTWGRWVSRDGLELSDAFLLSDAGIAPGILATNGETFATTVGPAVYFVRRGEPITSQAMPDDEVIFADSIASNGEGFVTAFLSSRPVGTLGGRQYYIRVVRFDDLGHVTSDIDLLPGRRLLEFELASNGKDYLIAGWESQGFYGRNLIALRISATGTPTGPTLPLHSGEYLTTVRPGITSIGGRYLIAASWGEDYGIDHDLVFFEIESATATVKFQGPGSRASVAGGLHGEVVAIFGISLDENVSRLYLRGTGQSKRPSRRGVRRF